MDLVTWLLFGVLPAVAAMLLGVGVGGSRWFALAFAAAICVPAALAKGWPDWLWQLDFVHGPPRPALWWTLVIGGVLGTVYDFRLLPKSLALVLESVLVAMLPWFLSSPLRASWSFEECALFLVTVSAVVTVLWFGLRQAAKRLPGLPVPLAMMIALGVDAWLLFQHAAGPDWQLAGVASVALGVAVMTASWHRPFVCGSGAVLCLALAHSGLLLAGRNEQELLQVPLILAWLAPAPMLVAVLPWFRQHARISACLSVLAVGACGGLAVWLSVRG